MTRTIARVALAGASAILLLAPPAGASRPPKQGERSAIVQAVEIGAPSFLRDPQQHMKITRIRISKYELAAASVAAGVGVRVQFARVDVGFAMDPETGHRPGAATFALFRALMKGGFGTWKVYDIGRVGVGCRVPSDLLNRHRYLASSGLRQEYLRVAHDLNYAFFTPNDYYSCDMP